MGVDGVGRAGDEGAVVPAGDDVQPLGAFRLDDVDLVDLIGQHLVHDVQVKLVTFAEFVQISEEHSLGQTAVAGQHAVGALAAKGIACAFQMADALGEHLVGRALVDGQVHVDLGDRDVAKAVVALMQREVGVGLARRVAVDRVGKLLVVGAGSFLCSIEPFGVHGLNRLVVAVDDLRRIALRQRIADDRIRRHRHARKDHQRRKPKF